MPRSRTAEQDAARPAEDGARHLVVAFMQVCHPDHVERDIGTCGAGEGARRFERSSARAWLDEHAMPYAVRYAVWARHDDLFTPRCLVRVFLEIGDAGAVLLRMAIPGIEFIRPEPFELPLRSLPTAA